jgi:hypothetical protein
MKKLFLCCFILFSSMVFAEPKRGDKDYFANCPALIKVYPLGVYKTHKAYRKTLDTDKNGWACERKFPDCESMRQVFPNGVNSLHPSYSKKLDRDKDNWACERN